METNSIIIELRDGAGGEEEVFSCDTLFDMSSN